MENILPVPPNKLPRMADGTVLNFPITVSISTPVEKLKFWQSATFLFFAVSYVFIGGIYFFITQVVSYQILIFYKIVIGTVIFVLIMGTIIGFNQYRKYPYNVIPNFFIAKNIHWQTIPIMIINKNEILLTHHFTNEKKIIELAEVERFIISELSRHNPHLGFTVEYINVNLNTKYNGLTFKPVYDIHQYYVLINNKIINLRELLNLMNTAIKNNENHITFLSMSKHLKQMDIGYR